MQQQQQQHSAASLMEMEVELVKNNGVFCPSRSTHGVVLDSVLVRGGLIERDLAGRIPREANGGLNKTTDIWMMGVLCKYSYY